MGKGGGGRPLAKPGASLHSQSAARPVQGPLVSGRFGAAMRARASDDIFRKTGRPIEGGPNTHAAYESADVRDSFLGPRPGGSRGLCRKLEHCCVLTFKHVS